MTVFYSGSRSVLKGRNSNDSVNPYTGAKGTYSNWAIFNTSHALDGAPNNNHVAGTGRSPHGVAFSRYFTGLDVKTSSVKMRDSGKGARIAGMRFRPLENKAAGNNRAFATYGHIPRQVDYSAWDAFDDTKRERRLDSPGHVVRAVDATGTANSFGSFGGNVNKGVSTTPMSTSTHTVASNLTNPYGHEQVLVWQGVTSGKALGV